MSQNRSFVEEVAQKFVFVPVTERFGWSNQATMTGSACGHGGFTPTAPHPFAASLLCLHGNVTMGLRSATHPMATYPYSLVTGRRSSERRVSLRPEPSSFRRLRGSGGGEGHTSPLRLVASASPGSEVTSPRAHHDGGSAPRAEQRKPALRVVPPPAAVPSALPETAAARPAFDRFLQLAAGRVVVVAAALLLLRAGPWQALAAVVLYDGAWLVARALRRPRA